MFHRAGACEIICSNQWFTFVQNSSKMLEYLASATLTIRSFNLWLGPLLRRQQKYHLRQLNLCEILRSGDDVGASKFCMFVRLVFITRKNPFEKAVVSEV